VTAVGDRRLMPLLTSRAPRPVLSDHPEFALMLLATLQHFRCTLGEVREDYWMGRVWRALTGDPALQGRVARQGVSTILLTGAGYDVPPASAKERDRWRLHVQQRVAADTGRSLRALGILLQWATGPVVVQRARVVSLIAQAVDRGPRWGDLAAWVGDLAPVVVPVVVAVGTLASDRRVVEHREVAYNACCRFTAAADAILRT